MAIESYLLVGDVMARWPATIRVFLDFKLSCVGCPIASFHSIEDACREHDIDEVSFMAALRGAVDKPEGLRHGSIFRRSLART